MIKARNVRLALLIFAENILAWILIEWGIVRGAAIYVAQLLVAAAYPRLGTMVWIGFSELDWESTFRIVVAGLNFAVQFCLVKLAVRKSSRRLGSRASFVLHVWDKAFFKSLPLLGMVFAFDCANCFVMGDIHPTFLVFAWLSYFYAAAIVVARRRIKKRAIGVCPLCKSCGYWLRGARAGRCPECGALVLP